MADSAATPPLKLSREETLETVWTRLRLELLALMDSPTPGFDAQGGHGKPSTTQPPAAGAELRHFERQWARCKTNGERRDLLLCPDCRRASAKPGGVVICCAIGCLRSFKLPSEDIRKKRGTQEWREAVANDPLPCRVVARRWGVKKDTVLAWRREYLTDPPRPGRPKVAA